MGCSNTIKKRSIKVEGIKKEPINSNLQRSQPQSRDSAGTNDGKSNSDEKNKEFTLTKDSRQTRFSKEINEKNKKISDREDKEIPSGCLRICVECDTTEIMFPVWIERGVETKLWVTGKWGLIPEYGLVSYIGHSNFPYKYRDANIGALIGRIQGGQYFKIENGMTIKSEISGPLYLFSNNSRFSVQPIGSVNVFLQNAKSYSINMIEKMLGWDIDSLDTTHGHDYLSDVEKQQIILLNKIRSNPKLFAQQYLVHLGHVNENYKEIYNKLLRYPSSKLLNPNKALFMAAKEHAIDIGYNGTTGHKSTDGSDLRTRISKYTDKPNYFGENCSYNLKDPLSIIIQLVVDDGNQSKTNRANILNEVYDQVGISSQEHSSYKYMSVQVYGYNIKMRSDI